MYFVSPGLLTRLVMMSRLNNKTELFQSTTIYQIRVLCLLSLPNLHFSHIFAIQNLIKDSNYQMLLFSVKKLIGKCKVGSRSAALPVLIEISARQRKEDGRLIST